MQDTVVTFPAGALAGTGTVVWSSARAVVLDATPFHPVDHTWPDQPGDTGVLRAGPWEHRVAEAVMAAADVDGAVFIGEDIPVRRGEVGWTWLVAHRLEERMPQPIPVGTVLQAQVDPLRRAALSRGHTACHLASLALDAAVADLWRKDPGRDGLGGPDFEGRANQTSSIRPDGAVDVYRLGKSLRRAGFDTEGFTASPAARERGINDRLAAWIGARGLSRIVADGPGISDRRRWECELPEGTASIPCGGTHAASLADFAGITVVLEMTDPQTLTMTTTAVPAV